MAILNVILSDKIKASADYSEYLAKSLGTKPFKSHGKGLLTKQGVKVVVERVSIAKKRRLKTMIEETGQSEEVADTKSDEENLDHSSKLKGIKILSVAAQFKFDLKKARKARSGVTQTVPYEPRGSSSNLSSEFDDDIEEISSDDEGSEADDIEKADAEKVETGKAEEEKAREEQNVNNQESIDQPKKVQAKDSIPEPQVEKPTKKLLSSSQTLSSVEYVDTTVTLIPQTTTLSQKQLKRSKTKRILKKSRKPKTQVDTEVLENRLTRLEKKVEVMSRFNIPKAIDKSFNAQLMKNVLPKGALEFGKIRQEKSTKQSMQTHRALYDALIQSLIVDEDEMDKQLKYQSTPKIKIKLAPQRKGKYPSKSSKTDKSVSAKETVQDVEIDARESVKEDVVDAEDPSQVDASSWFNKMVNAEKDPSKPSKTDKSISAEETVHDVEIDAGESIEEDVVATEDLSQADASVPKSDKSTWFKIVVFERPRSPYPEWHKETMIDDALNNLGLMKCKPLPLHGAPGRLTILVDFFFNKDLKYLTTDNVEKKYATSLTKLKGIEEMISKLWSSSKVAYEEDVAFEISYWGPKRKLFYRARQVVQSIHKVYSRMKILSIIRISVVKQFGDGTLKKVHEKLDYMLHNFELGYNDGMPKSAWTDKDKKRTASMLEKIEKMLLTRQIMRNLEFFMGGRRIKTDYRLLTRTKWLVIRGFASCEYVV
nr:hypothetical protein [Tanacetum cinerariifolium]